jgi:hypothetical protein
MNQSKNIKARGKKYTIEEILKSTIMMYPTKATFKGMAKIYERNRKQAIDLVRLSGLLKDDPEVQAILAKESQRKAALFPNLICNGEDKEDPLLHRYHNLMEQIRKGELNGKAKKD